MLSNNAVGSWVHANNGIVRRKSSLINSSILKIRSRTASMRLEDTNVFCHVKEKKIIRNTRTVPIPTNKEEMKYKNRKTYLQNSKRATDCYDRTIDDGFV